MKRNHLIPLLVLIISGCSPKIHQGSYCQPPSDGGGSCITFKNKNYFNWKTNYDFGPPSVGEGEYNIENDKLYLKFKKDSVVYDSSIEVLNSELAVKDEIALEILIVDFQKQPSPNAQVILNGNSNRKYYSDISGKVRIENIPKREEPIRLQVNPFDVLEKFSFDFIPNKNAELLVSLHQAKPRIISDTLYIFEILNVNPNKLLLKNSSGGFDIVFLRKGN